MTISDNPHILVTGASGAIGRHCVGAARRRGLGVSGLGHGLWEELERDEGIDFWVTGDVNIPALMHVTNNAGALSHIIHLAGGSHVGRSFANPAEDFQRTIVSAQQLLEWARLHAPQAAILFVSTAAVYGNCHSGPIKETAALAPTSPYGAHKLIMEQLVASYVRNFGIRAGIVRPFSVYGPGLRKQMIWELSKRLARSSAGEPPMLGGTGDETRDWVYMVDAAELLLDAALKVSNEMFRINLCTGRAVTIRDIASRLCSAWAHPAPQFSGERREGDPLHLVGDPGLAQDMNLGAVTPLEDGLASTVAWIRAELARGPVA